MDLLFRVPGYVVGSSDNSSLAADVALLSLEHALSNFQHQDNYAKELASMLFHLILIIPKVLLSLS